MVNPLLGQGGGWYLVNAGLAQGGALQIAKGRLAVHQVWDAAF